MDKITIQNMGENLGDFFLIELERDVVKCVIMVDGHTIQNGYQQKIRSQIGKYESIDYLIVTHVDGDHIRGVSKYLNDKRFKAIFKNTVIIYNFVTKKMINYKDAYNFEKMVEGHYVIPTGRYDYINFSNELLQIISLEKRMKFDVNNQHAYLTLIAPDREGIERVYNDYNEKLKKANNSIKAIASPKTDIANHNSIVFLLEFAGKKLLFMGDNNIDKIEPLVDGLKNMSNEKIDLIKVGHHGALDENKRLVEFAKNHQCNQFIVTGEKDWEENSRLHPSEVILKQLNDSGLSGLKLYTKVEISKDEFLKISIDSSQQIEIG